MLHPSMRLEAGPICLCSSWEKVQTNKRKGARGGQTTRVLKSLRQWLYFENTLPSNHTYCLQPLKHLRQCLTTWKVAKLGVDEISPSPLSIKTT